MVDFPLISLWSPCLPGSRIRKLGWNRRAPLGGEGPDPATEWRPTVDEIVAVGSTQGHQNSTGRNRGASPAWGGHCNEMSYLRMVGAGRFELPTPCAQDIRSPHLRINRFNNLRTLLVGPYGNFSYNLDCKAAIQLVKPPTIPSGSPAGSAVCEIQSTLTRTCCCGSWPVSGRTTRRPFL